MQSYIIQRAEIRKELNASKRGVDSIISLEYMGYSEYEWGATGKSLERVRNAKDEYKTFTLTSMKGGEKLKKNVIILCKSKDESNVLKNLYELAEHKLHCKAYTSFSSAVKGSTKFKQLPKTNFWWDLEHDFFFWLDAGETNDLITKLILNQ